MPDGNEWVGLEPTPQSPYYPFFKAMPSADMKGAEELPYKLTRYLMDLPLAGYTPPSSNEYPRARLKKLIFHDGRLPLEEPLPTAEQIKAIMFDPTAPDAPSDVARGYRVFSQELVGQSQNKAQSTLRISLAGTQRITMRNTFVYRQSILYTVAVHYGLEANMGTVGNSRAWAIVQAILEATEGVNFGGIGTLNTFQIARFDDDIAQLGYKIYQYIDFN